MFKKKKNNKILRLGTCESFNIILIYRLYSVYKTVSLNRLVSRTTKLLFFQRKKNSYFGNFMGIFHAFYVLYCSRTEPVTCYCVIDVIRFSYLGEVNMLP